MMTLGAQLFTLRNYCKDLNSFAETLKKVAAIGYTDVQVSGTCEYDAAWLAEQLDRNGLTCSITHTNPNRIILETEKVIADHNTFHCKYIGIGSLPGGVANYFSFREDIREAARKIAASGKTLMIHNHHREFERSGPEQLNFLEYFMNDFSEQEIGFTFDTYWAQYAGADPAYWIEKMTGRLGCVHLKDMQVIAGEQKMAPVGSGNMNFERILAACEKAGTKHLLVEQDDCNGIDPFICLTRSYKYLNSLGLR